MKIPFNIKFCQQIESGEYKVETRIGSPVRILTFDKKGDYPIVALVDTRKGEFVTLNDIQGYHISEKTQHPNDLFIITPEPELSEWQAFISGCLQKHGLLDCGAADRIAKECSAELLKLAYQELKAKLEQDFFEAKQDGIKEGIEVGKAEALKYLPKWKKGQIPKNELAIRQIGISQHGYSVVYGGKEESDIPTQHYILISDLEKLPYD